MAIQIYRGILKQRQSANDNTPIYLCIYLDFLYTCRDVRRCRLCYLRAVWQELALTRLQHFALKLGYLCWGFIMMLLSQSLRPLCSLGPGRFQSVLWPGMLHRSCTARGAALCVFEYLQCAGSVCINRSSHPVTFLELPICFPPAGGLSVVFSETYIVYFNLKNVMLCFKTLYIQN